MMPIFIFANDLCTFLHLSKLYLLTGFVIYLWLFFPAHKLFRTYRISFQRMVLLSVTTTAARLTVMTVNYRVAVFISNISCCSNIVLVGRLSGIALCEKNIYTKTVLKQILRSVLLHPYWKIYKR